MIVPVRTTDNGSLLWARSNKIAQSFLRSLNKTDLNSYLAKCSPWQVYQSVCIALLLFVKSEDSYQISQLGVSVWKYLITFTQTFNPKCSHYSFNENELNCIVVHICSTVVIPTRKTRLASRLMNENRAKTFRVVSLLDVLVFGHPKGTSSSIDYLNRLMFVRYITLVAAEVAI